MNRNGNVIAAERSTESVTWILSDVLLKAIPEIWFNAASIEVCYKFMIVNMLIRCAAVRHRITDNYFTCRSLCGFR